MQPEVSILTHNEKDYCHFCFGAINLVLLFPHVRPDLKSFIDNVIGIQLSTDVEETFTLCGECIGTMDMFITFRAKCRSHYDKVCEMKIMNQAAKKMFPLLQQQQHHTSTNHASPASTTAECRLNDSIIDKGWVYPEVCLVEGITSPTNGRTETVTGYAGSARSNVTKRIYSQSPSPDIGADSGTKKLRTQNDSNRKTKCHHIRDLMKRFRENRSQNNEARKSLSSSTEAIPKRIDFTNDQPLANGSTTTRNITPPCKPCVVVVNKCLPHQTIADLCK